MDPGACLGVRPVEINGLLWQPFERRAVCQIKRLVLPRQRPLAAIKARRPRRGQQGMRPPAKRGMQAKRITAHDTAGRMDQINMTTAVWLGIKGLLRQQRPAVPLARQHGPAGPLGERQVQPGGPGGGGGGHGSHLVVALAVR